MQQVRRASSLPAREMLILLSPQVGKREETQFQQPGLQAVTLLLFLPPLQGSREKLSCPGLVVFPAHLAETPCNGFLLLWENLKLTRATGHPVCLQPHLLWTCFGFPLESCPCYLRAFAPAIFTCGNVPLCAHFSVMAQLPAEISLPREA